MKLVGVASLGSLGGRWMVSLYLVMRRVKRVPGCESFILGIVRGSFELWGFLSSSYCMPGIYGEAEIGGCSIPCDRGYQCLTWMTCLRIF
jgi:hypothetical protein